MGAYLKDIILAIIFLIYPFFLLVISKQMSNVGFGKDATRKFVHIAMGVVVLFVPFFDHLWIVIIPPIMFILANLIDYRYGLLSQISGEDRGNIGTVLYPISYLILIIVFFHTKWWGLAVLGILSMAFGDAGASIFGRNLGFSKYTIDGETRSVGGSAAMFIITFVVSLVVLLFYGSQMGIHARFMTLLPSCFIIAASATIIEALSIRGSDNITVPLLTPLTAWILFAVIAPNVLGDQTIVLQPIFG